MSATIAPPRAEALAGRESAGFAWGMVAALGWGGYLAARQQGDLTMAEPARRKSAC